MDGLAKPHFLGRRRHEQLTSHQMAGQHDRTGYKYFKRATLSILKVFVCIDDLHPSQQPWSCRVSASMGRYS